MAPTYHPAEELLLEYASGSAPEAVALLVATHLALCPSCRAHSAALDALGGELLDALEPAPLESGLDAVLARLGGPPEPARLPRAAAGSGGPLPSPLRDYVGPLEESRWRRILPGVQQIELPLAVGGVPVRLVRLRGGTVVPAHTHTAEELSLVLTGGFEDEHGHYLRGDVSTYGGDDTHTQHIDRGEPCITLVVSRGRMVPVDWKGRLLEKLTGGF